MVNTSICSFQVNLRRKSKIDDMNEDSFQRISSLNCHMQSYNDLYNDKNQNLAFRYLCHSLILPGFYMQRYQLQSTAGQSWTSVVSLVFLKTDRQLILASKVRDSVGSYTQFIEFYVAFELFISEVLKNCDLWAITAG